MSSSQSPWSDKSTVTPVKKRLPIAYLSLILLLILVLAIGAVPGYLKLKWPWQDMPKVANIEPLKNIRTEGLSLAGWKTLQQEEILLGGNQWSLQIIAQGEQSPVTLLLMPQDYYTNKPEVEWSDVNALEHWKRDSYTTFNFKAENPSAKSSLITARFFRAWSKATYAVVQWYAWPGGGNYSPSRWFWIDQWAQLRQQRVPWVAVCLKIPINPLSTLKSNQQAAVSLAQTVQATLENRIFNASLIAPNEKP